MGRLFLLALLVAGLLLQGEAATSADLLPEAEVGSHCAGSEPAQDDGDCCDEGMNAGCAAHCQVAESPLAGIPPTLLAATVYRLAMDDRANPNPDYAPDLRPPIA